MAARPKGRLVLGEGGAKVAVSGLLPSRTRLVAVAPALTAAVPEDLWDEERYLARNVQVVLPRGADPSKYAGRLQGLAAVESVRVLPQISLP